MKCLPNFAGNIKPKIVVNHLIKYLTTLLLIPFSCLTLAADDSGGNNNTVVIPIKESAPQRPPRVPSRVYIECSYGVGYVLEDVWDTSSAFSYDSSNIYNGYSENYDFVRKYIIVTR